MKPLVLVAATLTLLAGCGGEGEGADDLPPDSVTQRQRDSVIGESGLPGAGGVRGALEASDAAADRATTVDSLSGGP